MTYLTKQQRKLLYKLLKESSIDCSNLSSEEIQIVKHLDELGFLNAKREECIYPSFPKGEYKVSKGRYLTVHISEKGKSYFVERDAEFKRFLIPITISILALLISAISLIMQLPVYQTPMP